MGWQGDWINKRNLSREASLLCIRAPGLGTSARDSRGIAEFPVGESANRLVHFKNGHWLRQSTWGEQQQKTNAVDGGGQLLKTGVECSRELPGVHSLGYEEM